MNFNLYKRLFFNTAFLNPIQDGPFWGYSWMGGGRGRSQESSLSKICHTYPTAAKLIAAQLYLAQRRSKKYLNQVTHPFSSADISISSPEISKFY